jgi:5-methylcytosine-specific restriction endonuclease McrA
MLRDLQTMAYYETYYYANVIDNVLKDCFSYLRSLNEWHEDREGSLLLTPFPKWSLLHDFSAFIIRDLAYERIDDRAENVLSIRERCVWVDDALRHHGMESPGFMKWLREKDVAISDLTEDHAHDYYRDLALSGQLEDLFEHLSNEVFFLLFSNRSLLANLNSYASSALSHVDREWVEEEHRDFLASSGVLRRAHLPEWVRRAVYFRDRGRCVACNADLTGLVSLQNDDHFDHIIPLHQHGLNDVTNIQLLCASCNLKKGHRNADTWNRYERWY